MTLFQQKIKSAEDTAFAAATGEDFGFKKLKRAPNWATEISYVNGDGKGLERAINCQRCAVAIEARMRGLDVIARPSYGFTDEMRNTTEWLKVFDYSPSEIKKCSGKTAAEVIKSAEEIIRNFGEGARAVIWFKWSKESGYRDGHAIVAECKKGEIVNFGDPQTKERAAAYKLKMADFDSIGILRVDNLKFTDLVKRCCMNRGDKNDNV